MRGENFFPMFETKTEDLAPMHHGRGGSTKVLLLFFKNQVGS